MSNTCPITNKRVNVAGSYSNRVRATQFNPCGKRKQRPNMQKKTIYVAELGKSIRLSLSTKGIKTINKRGAYVTLKKAGVI